MQDPAQVRMAALELIVEQLLAVSLEAHPETWGLFEDSIRGSGQVEMNDRAAAGEELGGPAELVADDVANILRAARQRADFLRGGEEPADFDGTVA